MIRSIPKVAATPASSSFADRVKRRYYGGRRAASTFVSFCGSSLIASYMAAGLLLNAGQNRPLMIGRESFEFDGE